MIDLENKKVVVLGLNPSGLAASYLLAQCGAKVVLIDRLNTDGLERAAKEIDSSKITVKLGATALPEEKFDFAVVSPEVSLRDPFLAELKQKMNLLYHKCQLVRHNTAQRSISRYSLLTHLCG